MTSPAEEQDSAPPRPAARSRVVRAVVAGAATGVLCAVFGRFEFDSEWLYVPWGFGLVVGAALVAIGLAMWGVTRLVFGPGLDAGGHSLGRSFALVGLGGLTLFLVLSVVGLVQGEKLF